MKTNVKRSKSRIVAQVLAVFLVVALLMGATYAWQSFNQPKTNEFSGRGDKYDATLIESFNPDDATDWEEGEEIAKTAYVKNMGEAPVYVRLTLKEYMEIALPRYVYSEQRFAVYPDGPSAGEFIFGETYDGAASVGNVYGFTGAPTYMTDALTGKSGYFILTDWDDVNGQYGKKIVTAIESGIPTPVIPGTLKGDDSGFTDDDGNENEYNWSKYAWDASANEAIREYIHMNLVEVMTLAAWLDNTPSEPCWIVDEADPTYIYWSVPLEPQAVTTELITGVELTNRPEGNFYYGNRFDLEAVSVDDLKLWNAPDVVRGLFDVELALITPIAYGSNRLSGNSIGNMGFMVFDVNFDLDLTPGTGKYIEIAVQYAPQNDADPETTFNANEVVKRTSLWGGIFVGADKVTGAETGERYPIAFDSGYTSNIIPAGTRISTNETSVQSRYSDLFTAVQASGPDGSGVMVRTVLRIYDSFDGTNYGDLIQEVVFPPMTYLNGGQDVLPNAGTNPGAWQEYK